MAIIALLIGVVLIFGFIAYWVVMITLFMIGIVFVFWAVVFAMLFGGDPYAGALCSVFATGITFWLFSLHSEKNKSG